MINNENFQDEALVIPQPVDQLLSDYAKRFNEIKTPRKLLWKKNLGAVKVRFFNTTYFECQMILDLLSGWSESNLNFSILNFSDRSNFSILNSPKCILIILVADILIQLELQFEDREMQFTVAPILATIIMKFQDQAR